MSKKEFKVGDDVLVRGKIASVELETVVIDVGISWLVGMHKNEVTHAPVKDDTVYEYKYLFRFWDSNVFQESSKYYLNKKEFLTENPHRECQRLTHTKRVRK